MFPTAIFANAAATPVDIQTSPDSATATAATSVKPAKPSPTAAGTLPDALLLTVLIGAASAQLTRIIRTRVSAALLAGPPIGCDTCMAFWTSLVLIAAWWWWGIGAVLAPGLVLWFGTVLLAAGSVAYLLLGKTNTTPPAP